MLTQRFADALAFARALHNGQTRNGTQVPYFSHLMAVSAIVLENGGDEDQAIAGLLHDAVEDQGGLATARLIGDQFGPSVAQLVLACTDAVPSPSQAKPRWQERKTAFIARIPRLPRKAALVVTADKLHNLSCLTADLTREGPTTLNRFSRPAQLAWYYSGVAHALDKYSSIAPVHRLQALAHDFTKLVSPYDLPKGSLDV